MEPRNGSLFTGEEMEPRNGNLSQNGVETSVMIVTDTSEMDTSAKPSPALHMHGLRNLAIASIICGCSCLGVVALIYAIKAAEKQKAGLQEMAANWAQKSKRMSLISIGIWLGLLILVPLSMVWISYIISKAE